MDRWGGSLWKFSCIASVFCVVRSRVCQLIVQIHLIRTFAYLLSTYVPIRHLEYQSKWDNLALEELTVWDTLLIIIHHKMPSKRSIKVLILCIKRLLHVFWLTFPLTEIHKIQPKEMIHGAQNIKQKLFIATFLTVV